MGFEKEALDSMSYKELGQHLVTDQGMRSRPVEGLEGSFKAIPLLAGANNPSSSEIIGGPLIRVIEAVNPHSRWTGRKAMGDDNRNEAGGVLIPGPTRSPLSTDFGAIHDSPPAYKPFLTLLRWPCFGKGRIY